MDSDGEGGGRKNSVSELLDKRGSNNNKTSEWMEEQGEGRVLIS